MLTKYDELVKDQIVYGGKKYAHSNEREVTDILIDVYGISGLLWTIHKYVYRYKNLGREKDLLKIGAYMYILWLKYGFNISPEPQPFLKDTNLQVKEKYFDKFIDRVNIWGTDNLPPILELVLRYEKLNVLLSGMKYSKLESPILNVYFLIRELWNQTFREQIVHDTDTWNDAKFVDEK